MTASTCLACHDKPVHDTYVCNDCLDDYHGNLGHAPSIALELVLEVAKLSRKGRSPDGHVRRTEQPLPYSPHASEALARLRSELVSAVRIVSLDDRASWPADTIDAMCEWLTRMEQSVALRPEGGDILTGLADALAKGRRIIDLPPERRYVGDCPCGDDGNPSRLLAEVGQTMVVCRRCGTGFKSADCIAQLEDQMRDRLVTPAEVQTATAGRIKRSRVDQWLSRGRITRHPDNRVRFGDALDLEEVRREGRSA